MVACHAVDNNDSVSLSRPKHQISTCDQCTNWYFWSNNQTWQTNTKK